MTTSLSKLNKKIISCTRCTRLVEFRGKIAVEKRKQYINEEYWGKPITGYGDPDAQLLMVGLAPAAHGVQEIIFLLSLEREVVINQTYSIRMP